MANILERLAKDRPDLYDLMEDLAEIQLKKGHDYANGQSLGASSNLVECEKMGVPAWKGILIRMGDKWVRLCHFARRGFVKDESEGVEDTLFDLANYSLLCILAHRKAQEEGAELARTAANDRIVRASCYTVSDAMENPGLHGVRS